MMVCVGEPPDPLHPTRRTGSEIDQTNTSKASPEPRLRIRRENSGIRSKPAIAGSFDNPDRNEGCPPTSASRSAASMFSALPESEWIRR